MLAPPEQAVREPPPVVPATVARYRLVAELGRGGMANVFLAVSDAMGGAFSKLVVVKQLREHLATDPEFVTMFLDEARLAARLNHPNVVQTLDSGHVGSDLFIAMEYLDGQSFQRVLARAKGTLPLAMRLAVVSDTLAGLQYAHELTDFDGSTLNVVHRDVTPHNVFVTYEGQVKVLDFGIARADGRASQTRHGVIKGKLAYMAPEQARGDVIDPRADVFGAGVMLYEALTGTRLWGDSSDKTILRSLLIGQMPPPPRERVSSVPEPLDAICRRALAFRREDRYPSALAMQQDVEEVLESLGRPSARRLGAEVTRLFEDRRTLTRRVIEKQLAHLSSESRLRVVSLSTSMPPAADDGVTPSHVHEDATARMDYSKDTRVGVPDADLLAEAGGDSGQRSVQSPGTLEPPISRRTKLLAAALGGMTFAGLAMAGVYATAGDALLSTEATEAREAPPARVRVTLRASPEHASFRIDDGPSLPNPYDGELPRDDQAHKLVVEADGYPRREHTIRLNDDVSMRMVLSR